MLFVSHYLHLFLFNHDLYVTTLLTFPHITYPYNEGLGQFINCLNGSEMYTPYVPKIQELQFLP